MHKIPVTDYSFFPDFIFRNQFTDFTMLADLRKSLKEELFEEFKRLEYKELLIIQTAIEKHNYKVKNYGYDMWNLIHNSKQELIMLIKYDLNPNWKPEKYMLIRQISPPLEAYVPIPFNKMDIRPSGRDYGLLFE